MLRARWIIAALLPVGAAGSCAVKEFVAYPPAWPELIGAASCADMSGRYVNEAVATTLWRSPTNPDTARGFLSAALGFVSEVPHRDVAVIELDVNDRAVTLYLRDPPRSTAISLPEPWRCAKSGELTSRFTLNVEAEGSVGSRAESLVSLSRARDGSLVVHDVTTTWAFPQGRGREESWMRFAAANDQSYELGRRSPTPRVPPPPTLAPPPTRAP